MGYLNLYCIINFKLNYTMIKDFHLYDTCLWSFLRISHKVWEILLMCLQNVSSLEIYKAPCLFRFLKCKKSASNAGDLSSTLGSGRSPGEGNGYPHQYSWLENSVDRGAWWATVHEVQKGRIWLTNTHTHTHTKPSINKRTVLKLQLKL